MLLKVFNKSSSKTYKGGIVGFLKFLKKSKQDKLEMPMDEDLDMPPPPPIGMKENLPPMPKFDEKPFSIPEEKITTLPDLEPIEPEISDEELPKPPEMPRFEKKSELVTPPKIIPPMPKIKPISPIEKMERVAMREGRGVLRHEEVPSKPIFLGVEKFKEIRRGINVARNDLKNAGEVLMKLMDMKDVKDKEFNKWKGTMEDIQKKMVFVDKNLFKGD